MENWAISVVGTVLLTVLADVILPDGQTNKYVKTALSVVVILAMLAPVVKIADGSLSFVSYDKQYQAQSQYLYMVEQKQESEIEQRLISELAKSGYKNCIVEAEATLNEQGLAIDKISVNLKNAVIPDGMSNILVTEDITDIVSKQCGVASEKVVISWQ